MQPDGIRFVRPLLGCGRNRQRAGLNDEEQTVRLSPHTLTERNAEAESKKYFVLLLSF